MNEDIKRNYRIVIYHYNIKDNVITYIYNTTEWDLDYFSGQHSYIPKTNLVGVEFMEWINSNKKYSGTVKFYDL
jgi:hypothetical protein